MSLRSPRRDRATGGALRRHRGLALLLVLPALLLLGALVVYPIGYSVGRSLFDASGHRFVGLDNYGAAFTDHATLTAVRNNAIWVAVAPALVTAVGLVFAVLTEKIRWATAFKLLVFMPMAISFLAAGIIFRTVYDADPHRGVLNAAAVAVHDTFTDQPSYPGARPRPGTGLDQADGGDVRVPAATGTVLLPLVGVQPGAVPATARTARPADGDGVRGTVFLDFVPGGGGHPGQLDPGKKGLPGVKVQLHDGARTIATTTTADDGTFRFSAAPSATASVVLPAADFAAPYRGIDWLGPAFVTPAIIGAYTWIWAGFAMVIIAGGLANLPRETIEAARLDGAGEWQILRRITVPQLAPVLGVVFITMVINAMKIFDLVYVIAPGPVQQDADVLALRLYLVSFGGGNDQGLGSALSVLLLLLVVPVMLLNIRRFRGSRS
ncbi:carbohydrate ABC transporter permease [Kitasatospora aureofaciens]|uniref:carbohydrate ABC transporter permease n=1 Tax=Kitasatospora aureofaciens TaxID=1894 RepID=UPI001C437F2C|nr:sugar ABC transporter permease [Kitasatospora aureofaciens]MBV6700336.1 sugar ABC transporter permease [Kitasatospora aureofaciens]